MKLLDLTFPSPAENVACDEALLDWCETGQGEELLRFWESPAHFVVVGYSGTVADEVDVAACERRGIPIYRRCSGGGAVVQGPGCLNYALILRITEQGPLRNITSANRFIMGQNRAAIESLDRISFTRTVAVRGHTDLCIGTLKFSGNSQRRRKNFLLFHGTFLSAFDLELIGDVLRIPSKQPPYRMNRRHAEFLMNLNLPVNDLKAALQAVWNASAAPKDPPLNTIARLAEQKYSTRDWNQKF